MACAKSKTHDPSDSEAPSVSSAETETVTEIPAGSETTQITEPLATQPVDETAEETPAEETTAEEWYETETDSAEPVMEMLPMHGDAYVMGALDSSATGAVHYALFLEHHRLYLGKDMILYGVYTQRDEIPCISFGTNLNLPVELVGCVAPDEGAFVKMTAVYTAPSQADDVPSVARMLISEVEILVAPEPDEQILYVIAERLFVRSTPDSHSEANKTAALSKGTAVRILEASCGEGGAWCKIAFDGDEGYVYVKAAYLSEDPPQ